MDPIYHAEELHNAGLSGEFRSTTIVFQAYLAGENNYPYQLNPHCDYIWDSYRDSEVLELLNAPITKADFIKARLAAHQIPPLELTDEQLDESGGDILVLHGSRGQLIKKLADFIVTTANDVWGVGGDDSYFDYYPDNFYVLDQLVPTLRDPALQALLNAAKAYVVGARYDDEEGRDLIGYAGEENAGAAVIRQRLGKIFEERGDADFDTWWNQEQAVIAEAPPFTQEV